MVSQNPFSPEDIRAGLNYMALGHFHNYYERDHEGCKIVNPGSMEKLSWAEMNDEKGFVWAELHGSNVSTEFVKLDTRPMEKYTLHLSKDERYSPNLKEYLINYVESKSDPVRIARLFLQGLIAQEQYNELKINEVIQATREAFFHLGFDRTELEVEGFGKVFVERVENPVEAFVRRLEELITKAGMDDERRRRLEQVQELGRKYLEEAKA